MADFKIEDRAGFTVYGVGTALQSDFSDWEGMAKEKHAFESATSSNGVAEQLKQAAQDNEFYTINELYNNVPTYYVGVKTDKDLNLSDGRLIQFPEGKYVVIPGTANSVEELRGKLTGAAFGGVLQGISDYAYVGGPNAVVEIEHDGNQVSGEMLVPVVKQ